MSQKRSAAFPPTEGRTEDTDVILEPTTAVPKRAHTTANAEGDDDDDAKRPAVRTPVPAHLNPTDPSQFDHFLFQLLAARAETNSGGGFNIAKDESPVLYAWLQFIKKEYKQYSQGSPHTSLTAQQVRVLESLHVPLTSRGDEHWQRYCELLRQYRARHGHVLVPRVCEVPGLGDWVTDQRRQYKAKHHGQASQMTEARQRQLEELGFVWHVRNRPEWEVRFAELVEYKAAQGDCKVPQHYKPNRSLGKWVAKQREQYKLRLKGQHSFLTPYREEKLNSIGFSWFVRSALETEVQSVLDEVHVSDAVVEGAASVKMEEAAVTAIKEEEGEPMPEEKTAEI
jgi:Helicase associated domain